MVLDFTRDVANHCEIVLTDLLRLVYSLSAKASPARLRFTFTSPHSTARILMLVSARHHRGLQQDFPRETTTVADCTLGVGVGHGQAPEFSGHNRMLALPSASKAFSGWSARSKRTNHASQALQVRESRRDVGSALHLAKGTLSGDRYNKIYIYIMKPLSPVGE